MLSIELSCLHTCTRTNLSFLHCGEKIGFCALIILSQLAYEGLTLAFRCVTVFYMLCSLFATCTSEIVQYN